MIPVSTPRTREGLGKFFKTWGGVVYPLYIAYSEILVVLEEGLQDHYNPNFELTPNPGKANQTVWKA